MCPQRYFKFLVSQVKPAKGDNRPWGQKWKIGRCKGWWGLRRDDSLLAYYFFFLQDTSERESVLLKSVVLSDLFSSPGMCWPTPSWRKSARMSPSLTGKILKKWRIKIGLHTSMQITKIWQTDLVSLIVVVGLHRSVSTMDVNKP